MKASFLRVVGFLIPLSVFMAGCSDLKRNMGLERTMPDEFCVSPHQQKLEIPPSFDLKPPKTGDASRANPFHVKEDPLARRGKLSPAEAAMMEGFGPGISDEGAGELDRISDEETRRLEQGRGLLEGKVFGRQGKPGKVIDPELEEKRQLEVEYRAKLEEEKTEPLAHPRDGTRHQYAPKSIRK